MEGEPQTPPAAEPATGGTAESPASAPSSFGGAAAWEAAFASDDGASNRDADRPAVPADPAPEADPAASSDAAPEAEGAPEGGSREPQPGSRRSTAAERDELREQVRSIAAELEAERQAKADREADAARTQTEAESFIGKPGELAALLSKEAEQGWLDNEDNERKLTLIRAARLYQPLLERARREAGTASAQAIEEARGESRALMDAWAQQFEAAISQDLPGLDKDALRKAPDLPSIVKAAHAAGAASRDGEVDDLKGRLTDARNGAFASQPRLATGGVSGSGRTERGYDPTRSPVSNLEDAFAEAVPASTNGRR